MGGRSMRDGIYVYISLIHFTVRQKVTQHLKQLNANKKKEKGRKKRRMNHTRTDTFQGKPRHMAP